jgi:hypothetical protein
MAYRRFAGLCAGAAVTFTRTIAIAIGALAVASALAGCATAPAPLSLEEQLGFDKATGSDLTGVPPGLRMQRPRYRYEGDGGYPPR